MLAPTTLPQDLDALKRRVALHSLLWALLLTTLKLGVGLFTHSLGVLSEALHSGLDLVAAGVTLLAVRASAIPADESHNYGHGKAESLAALVEVILLLGTSIVIIVRAIDRLVGGAPLELQSGAVGIAVMVIAIAIDTWRAKALKSVAEVTHSDALDADALHFSSDVASSFAVIVGLGLAMLGWKTADAIAALIVAAFVIRASARIGKQAFDTMMDRTPEALADRIAVVVDDTPGVRAHQDLRVRAWGSVADVDVTIKVDRDLSLIAAHTISEEVEARIVELSPGAVVSIHFEPMDATTSLSANA